MAQRPCKTVEDAAADSSCHTGFGAHRCFLLGNKGFDNTWIRDTDYGTVSGFCKSDTEAGGLSGKDDAERDELRACKDGRLKIIDGMNHYTEEDIKAALKGAGFSKVKADHHQNKPWLTVIARK